MLTTFAEYLILGRKLLPEYVTVDDAPDLKDAIEADNVMLVKEILNIKVSSPILRTSFARAALMHAIRVNSERVAEMLMKDYRNHINGVFTRAIEIAEDLNREYLIKRLKWWQLHPGMQPAF